MVSFWEVAATVAGIAAIGSFVMFGLYRGSIKSEALRTLTRHQRFVLFIILLSLTFVFTIGTLVLRAWELNLSTLKREQSAAEQQKVLDARHRAGERKFEEIRANPAATVEQKATVEKLHERYGELTDAASDALKEGEAARLHEAVKETVILLESDEAKKAIPEEQRRFILEHGCPAVPKLK